MSQCLQTPPSELGSSSSCVHPVFSPSLQCASALLNVSLRMLVHAAEQEREGGEAEGKREGEGEKEDVRSKEKEKETVVDLSLRTAQETLLMLCSSFNLFEACQKVWVV